MELITELFDEDTTLPITNLNPKKKIPQIFSVHVDDAIEQPGFRLCTYTSGGDTNRDLKMGDKMMHIVPFTYSAICLAENSITLYSFYFFFFCELFFLSSRNEKFFNYANYVYFFYISV